MEGDLYHYSIKIFVVISKIIVFDDIQNNFGY
jgi:hypothetical protein